LRIFTLREVQFVTGGIIFYRAVCRMSHRGYWVRAVFQSIDI
jgi:hypothetical protein